MIKRRLVLLAVISIFLGAINAYGEKTAIQKPAAQPPKLPDDPNHVVMVYDGKELTLGQVGYAGRLDYDSVEKFADFWLNLQLLFEQAEATGFDKEAKVAFLADLSYKKEIAGAFLKKQASMVQITDEQIQKYYNDNLDSDPRLKTPTYLSFSHITTKDASKAETVLKKINAGGDINELAKEFSEAKDASKGGRALKYQTTTVSSRYGKNIHDALLAAEEGRLIGPIKNKKGEYEIIRHEGKKASKIKDIASVSAYIKNRLEGEVKNGLIEKTIKSLKDKAKGKYQKTGVLAQEVEAADTAAEKKDNRDN